MDARGASDGWVRASLILSVATILCVAAPPLIYRSGIVAVSVLVLFPIALLLGLGVLILMIVHVARSVRSGAATNGLQVYGAGLLALAALSLPVGMVGESLLSGVPPIHDITTDTEDPPVFVDVLALRRPTDNSTEINREVLALQRKAYPDLRSLHLKEAPATVFPAALQAAKEQGWDIVADVPREGRIEATATTFFMGFKDDVVIRIREENGGSRIDVRSASRVGQGDLGANEKRIRLFLAALESKFRRSG